MRDTPRTVIAGAMIVAAASIGHVATGQSRYKIVDLTEKAQKIGVVQSEARAINERGEIVGFEVIKAFIERAIRWEADGTAHLLEGFPKDNSTAAVAIDEAGNILGVSELVTFVQCGNITKIFEEQKATLWIDGVPFDLNDRIVGDPPFELRFGMDLSNAGQITGFGRTPKGPPFTPKGFLLDGGSVTDLDLLDRPVAISDAGKIVGHSTALGQDKAFLWEGGVLINLHEHDSINGVTSRAYDISPSGLITGEVQFAICCPEEPAVWIGLEPVRLAPEFARPQGIATGVNAHDDVVGFFNDLDDIGSPFRGFIWSDGVRTDLLDLLDELDGWEVLFPFDINDRGRIVGGGVRDGTLGHGFVMIPLFDADLADVAVVAGTLISGGLAEVSESDDTYLRARSEVSLSAFEPNLVEVVVGAGTGVPDPAWLDVLVESRIDHPNGTGRVRLRNWSTGSFVQVGLRALAQTDQVFEIENIPADAYVRKTDGRIEVSLRCSVIATLSLAGFQSFIDHVRVAVAE